jgi:hypothetical protein
VVAPAVFFLLLLLSAPTDQPPLYTGLHQSTVSLSRLSSDSNPCSRSGSRSSRHQRWRCPTTRSTTGDELLGNKPWQNQRNQIWEEKNKTKTDCLLCFFSFLQVTRILTVGRKVKRGGSRSRLLRPVEFLAAARESTRRQCSCSCTRPSL